MKFSSTEDHQENFMIDLSHLVILTGYIYSLDKLSCIINKRLAVRRTSPSLSPRKLTDADIVRADSTHDVTALAEGDKTE